MPKRVTYDVAVTYIVNSDVSGNVPKTANVSLSSYPEICGYISQFYPLTTVLNITMNRTEVVVEDAPTKVRRVRGGVRPAKRGSRT